MKIFIDFLFFLMFLHLLLLAAASEDSTDCPPEAETPNCTCFPSAQYISCTELNVTTEPFNLTKNYRLKSLLILSKNNLPMASENFGKFFLHVETLVIQHEEFSPGLLPNLNSIESFFMLSTSAVQIVSSPTVNQSLDVGPLSNKLTSLVITDVRRVEGFDFKKFFHLEHLSLENVGFLRPITNVELIDRRLTQIQITNVTGLKGAFVFKPQKNTCLDEEKIVIDLHDTNGLDYFDFSHIFDDAKCSYKIDLSGTSMKVDLLTKQAQSLATQKVGKFYLIMRNVPAIDCDCHVWDLFKNHSGYVHSVQCKLPNGVVKYLSQIVDRKTLTCPDSSATVASTTALTTVSSQTNGTTGTNSTATTVTQHPVKDLSITTTLKPNGTLSSGNETKTDTQSPLDKPTSESSNLDI